MTPAAEQPHQGSGDRPLGALDTILEATSVFVSPVFDRNDPVLRKWMEGIAGGWIPKPSNELITERICNSLLLGRRIRAGEMLTFDDIEREEIMLVHASEPKDTDCYVGKSTKCEVVPIETILENQASKRDWTSELKADMPWHSTILDHIQHWYNGTTRSGSGILVTGAAASGKSNLAAQLDRLFPGCSTLVDVARLRQSFRGQAERELKDHCQRIIAQADYNAQRDGGRLTGSLKGMLILDNVDAIASRRAIEASNENLGVLATLLGFLDLFNEFSKADILMVLVSGESPDTLHSALFTPTRIGRDAILVTGALSPRERLASLTRLLRGATEIVDVTEVANQTVLESMASQCAGYTIGDMARLCRELLVLCHKQEGSDLLTVFQRARRTVPPSVLLDSTVSLEESANDGEYVTKGLGAVIGHDHLVQELRTQVIQRARPEVFRKTGVPPVTGVVLHGPNGCGKLFVAKCLAAELGWNVVRCSVAELRQPLVGEAERAIKDVFVRAHQAAPSMLLVEQLELLGGGVKSFEGNDTSVDERMLAVFVAQMEQCKKRAGAGDFILVVGITEDLDMVAGPLLAPSRLGGCVRKLTAPSVDARLALLRRFCPVVAESDVNALQDTVRRTEGWAVSELRSVVDHAKFNALRDGRTTVTSADLQEGMRQTAVLRE
eukprot:Clim_evm18s171 gene=Clim_evmTU18s171